MDKVKQVIVVRNDLRSKLRAGKLAAQVAHASLGAVFCESYVEDSESRINTKCVDMSPELEHWFNNEFTKIVLRCDDEAHLLALHKQVEEAGILNALIRDAGHTVFDEPTYTCLGIGPALSSDLEPITGELRMY